MHERHNLVEWLKKKEENLLNWKIKKAANAAGRSVEEVPLAKLLKPTLHSKTSPSKEL